MKTKKGSKKERKFREINKERKKKAALPHWK
jgi:hypothetical protein